MIRNAEANRQRIGSPKNGIDAMPWPAPPYDLNPIENLWGEIKQNVSKNSPTSKA